MAASNQLVCVTGASGFLGSHIVRLLLRDGFRVLAVVRDLKKKERYEHLLKFNQSEGQLTFAEADLEVGPDVYAKVLTGCYGLIHTATPYTYTAVDPVKEIVQPAIAGTENAINGAIAAGVRRVVVTSSGGAVFHYPVPDGYVFTNKDWSTFTVEQSAYFASKRLAEQAAWNLWEANKAAFGLTVINALYIVGPTQSNLLQQSLTNVRRHLMGEVTALTPGQLGWVDVRDVAQSHIIGLTHPDAVGQRLICASETHSWSKFASKLKELFPDYPNVSDAILANPPPSQNVSFDNSPLRELGMPPFISFNDMLKATGEALIEHGLVPDLRRKTE